ncbi:MAG: tetratricopeptide repeat protein [Bryobacteraceae bacterium]|nr:tetratricopeptide repeat protein [Bryobacteraceae bacterium]
MYRRTKSPLGLTGAAALLVVAFAWPARAESARALVERGNQAYRERQYEEALRAYEEAAQQKPDSPHVWMNKGNALYRQGDFRGALDAYENAAARRSDPSLEARSKFNQGNAAFRQGAGEAQANPAQAIDSLRRGVRYYQDALRLDPKLDDARHNIEVARRQIQQLEELLKKQPPQPGDDGRTKDDGKQQQQQQQPSPASDDKQQREQQQQRQAGQREEKPQTAESAKDILDKEREDRRRRNLQAAVAIRPVDKDW